MNRAPQGMTCQGSASGSAAGGGLFHKNNLERTYAPEIANITVGGSVTWTNFGPSRHTTVSDAGLWSSGPLLPPGVGQDPNREGDSSEGDSSEGDSGSGESFTWIFTEAGIYPYHCELHPDKRGTIYVSLDEIPGGGSGNE